ncbi:MAG: glycoside hydrolase family 2 TIM barrel-domain containing protein [Elusimicrobiota bacterium]
MKKTPLQPKKAAAGILIPLLVVLSAPAGSQKHNDAPPAFQLFDKGTELIVNYEKYGDFSKVGQHQYRYIVKDIAGLRKAVGEGVYPNGASLQKDPSYQKMKRGKQLEGNVWDYLNSDNPQASFFKWASAYDQPVGLRQFYIAQILEKAGLYAQAIKAYQAVVIHFPKSSSMTSWKTPWYVGPAALDSIAFLTRKHPELRMRLDDGRLRIANHYDNNQFNDIYEINPGRIVPAKSRKPPKRIKLNPQSLKAKLGGGKVRLVQYDNLHWQLLVDDQPYLLRAISYNATPIGKSPDDESLVLHRDWMLADDNQNGKTDGAYDSWVDMNRNDQQDKDEPVIGDFQLLKEMGVNTLRLYHHGYNKALLLDLYQTYGIRVILGDYLGAYTIGSDAEWSAGTDYSDPEQKGKMLDSVRSMVELYKDEPYVLFWVLGNENNYGNANNARQNPKAYYELVNQAAQLIKSIDKDHPVAICNGDVSFFDQVIKYCPDIDIYGINAYRGSHGLGDSFWQDAAENWGKPVFVSEFGCPAYHHRKSLLETEELQAEYLRNNWDDIEYNTAGGPGAGNAIGGVLFEWLDEWWKAGPSSNALVHDTVGQFNGPFPDGWSYEEWFGVAGQGNGKNTPYERQLRKAYFVFKDELWNPKELAKRGQPQ